MGNQQTPMTSPASEAFKQEFLSRKKTLQEDTRRPESKRNGTGNIWKYALKAALEAAGFTVVLEKAHPTFKNGKKLKSVKSDISVYYQGVLICIIESKDYFTIDYVRRASGELSRIIKSYRENQNLEVIGFTFQGRVAYDETEETIEDELSYWDEYNIFMITMIGDKRRKVNGELQTTVNTDFDVKYDEVDKIVHKLNEFIQR
jgi:hypothetical protein